MVLSVAPSILALLSATDCFKNDTWTTHQCNLWISSDKSPMERVQPSHILVALLDAGKAVKLSVQMYADHKGGRAKTFDEFREQIPLF